MADIPHIPVAPLTEPGRTVVVLFSGGQDSTTCLWWAVHKAGARRIIALSVQYGQRHAVELEAARGVLDVFRSQFPNIPVEHEVLELGSIMRGKSPLTDHTREVETYADAESMPGGLEDTFVPGRNILFLTLAANRAYAAGADLIITGTAQEDFGGYPDCRREFIEAMEDALSAGMHLDGSRVHIDTPLMDLDKKATVLLAAKLPGCLDGLAYSHTCYNGQVPPCGECHACLLRARGFTEAGIPDPLVERVEVTA